MSFLYDHNKILSDLDKIKSRQIKVPTVSEPKRDKKESFLDKNPVTDFMGNLAYGALESAPFVGMGVMATDIASDNRLAQSFGSQDWKDESWSGRIGYTIGTGASLLGFMGTGAMMNWGFKTLGMGTKTIMKHSAKELSKVAKVGDKADDIIKNSYDLLAKGPLNKQSIRDKTRETMQKVVRQATGSTDDKLVDTIADKAIQLAATNRPGDISKAISFSLGGGKVGDVIGGAAHEAMLLGLYETISGEIGDYVANYHNLSDQEWDYKDWYSRGLHGMVTGAALSPVRFIPGGKAVDITMKGGLRSGMLHDVKAMGKALALNFRKDHSPKKKQAALQTIYSALGRDKFLATFDDGLGSLHGLEGYLGTNLKNLSKEGAEKAKVLFDRAFDKIKKDIPRTLLPALAGEIRKDALGSFGRAAIGSFVMNGWMHYDAWKARNEGQPLYGSEEYPWSRVVFDHFAGMLYMKKGKDWTQDTLSGKTRYKRYYNQTGIPHNGLETENLVRSLEVMGYSEKELDYFVDASLLKFKGTSNSVVDEAVDGSPELSSLKKSFSEKEMAGDEVATYLRTDPENLARYEVHIRKEIAELRRAGKKKEADDLAEKLEISAIVEDTLYFTSSSHHRVLKPMTKQEAIDFVNKISSHQHKGQNLTVPTAEAMILKSIEESVGRRTERSQDIVESYIKDSLKALGLEDMVASSSDGKISIHSSISDLLKALSIAEPVGAERQRTANRSENLLTVIQKANEYGIINLGEKGVRWQAGEITTENIKKFHEAYETSTDLMHQEMYGTPLESWRENVPGKDFAKGEFADTGILGKDLIFDSIARNLDNKRNNFTYDVITNKNSNGTSDLQRRISELYSGQKRLVIQAETAGNASQTEIAEVMHFVENLNNTKTLVADGFSGIGTSQKTYAEVKGLMEQFKQQVGDVMTDNKQFSRFKRHAYDRMSKELLADIDVPNSTRRALVGLLNTGDQHSMVIRRRGVLELPSGEALRKMLKDGSENLTDTDSRVIEDLINKYELKFQQPLSNKAGIKFSSDYIQDSDLVSRRDLKQELMRIANTVDTDINTDIAAATREIAKINMNIEKLVPNLQYYFKDGEIPDAINTMIKELNETSQASAEMYSQFLANKDAIGLRSLAESKAKWLELNKELKEASMNRPESIKKVQEKMSEIISEVLDKRDAALENTKQSVTEFITDRVEHLKIADASDMPHTGNTSISDAQWSTRWDISEKTIEMLKTNPKSMLESINKLGQTEINFLSKFSPDLTHSDILKSLAKKDSRYNATMKQYLDIVVKPFIESQKGKIEARAEKTGRNLNYEDFVTDTYQLLTQSLNSKKVPVLTYGEGRGFFLSETSVSTWDRGFNALNRALGIDHMPGAMSLVGQTNIGSRYISTTLNEQTLRRMRTESRSPINVEIDSKGLLGDDYKNTYGDVLVGKAKDKPTFSILPIDSKNNIAIHEMAYDSIERTFRKDKNLDGDFNSPLLKEIEGIIRTDKVSKEDAQKAIEKWIDTTNEIEGRHSRIESQVLLARMATSLKDKVSDIIMGASDSGSTSDIVTASTLKYLKLDSSRSGFVFDERSVNFTKDYFNSLGDSMHNKTKEAFEIFKSHVFDKDGNIRKKKILAINDESGDGSKFFSTEDRAKAQFEEHLKTERGMGETEAKEKASELAAAFNGVHASIVNGEYYNSLKEQIATLVVRGANKDWFSYGADGKIDGFRTVIKPIEFHSTSDASTGSSEVFVAKTAYKYDPIYESILEKLGVDAITFESSAKVNSFKKDFNSPYEKKFFDSSYTDDQIKNPSWHKEVISNISDNKNNLKVVEIDRSSIFIKSLSAEHDATLTSGFGNFLSERSLNKLSNITRPRDSVNDLTNRMQEVYNDPFAALAHAEQLKNVSMMTGDTMAKTIGLEGIVEAGGIPSFEFLQPQLERMYISEYLGRRNFTTSEVKNGSYSVMTAGSDLSAPIRERGMQTRFGGSGISYYESNKNVRDLMSGRLANEGISLIFQISKNKATELNEIVRSLTNEDPKNISEFKAGQEFVVTFDGEVLQSETSLPNKKVIDAISKSMLSDYSKIMDYASSEHSGIHTLGDLAASITAGVSASANNKAEYVLNKIKIKDTEPLWKRRGVKANGVWVAKVDLRTPMAGINDRVITKIEKLLDKRRGPVSEMNYLDVIDPQDADFDLDKSMSIFSLPGWPMAEIHALSGHQSTTADGAFDMATHDLRFTADGLITHNEKLRVLEKARPMLVRQHGVISLMSQMLYNRLGAGQQFTGSQFQQAVSQFSNKKFSQKEPPKFEDNLEIFSGKYDGRNDSMDLGPTFKIGNKTYKLALSKPSQLIDSVQMMKNIIKDTIDIYKNRADKAGEYNLIEHIWFDSKNSILKLYEVGKFAEPSPLSWNTAISDKYSASPYNVKKQLIEGIIKPLSDLFNLQNRTERLADGSSRKMSMYEMVSDYQDIKRRIFRLGTEIVYDQRGNPKMVNGRMQLKENGFAPLTEAISSWIGGGGEGKGGVSSHPLVAGLKQMEASLRRHFKDSVPATNSWQYVLSNKLKGLSETQFEDFLSHTLQSVAKQGENNRFASYLKYEIEQLQDIIFGYKARRATDHPKFDRLNKALAGKLALYEQVMATSNLNINMKNQDAKPRTRKGRSTNRTNKPIAVYKLKANFENVAEEVMMVRPGQQYSWNKGDMIIFDPIRYEFVNSTSQTQRSAMHLAFARRLPTLNRSSEMLINDELKRYSARVKQITNEISANNPATAPMKNVGYELYEYELARALKDVMATGESMSPGAGKDYGLQFLYSLLSPKVSDNIIAITDGGTSGKSLTYHYEQNVINERSVLGLLDKLNQGKYQDLVNPDISKEWYDTIIQEHRLATIIQSTPAENRPGLNVDSFRGKTRPAGEEFSYDSIIESAPMFMKTAGLNERAKSIMIDYLSGTRNLAPQDLYRLTLGLKTKGLSTPTFRDVGQWVDSMWQNTERFNVGGSGVWSGSKSRIKDRIPNVEKSIKESAEDRVKKRFNYEC